MEGENITNRPVFDVLIIGAGPGGLAVASRLREPEPSVLFTDGEHQRYHWVRKHGSRMSLKRRKNGEVIPSHGGGGGSGGDGRCDKCVSIPQRRYRTLVLDATSDRWMGRWDQLFGALDISHLRSPMFFHVDPSDRDALLAMAVSESMRHRLLYGIARHCYPPAFLLSSTLFPHSLSHLKYYFRHASPCCLLLLKLVRKLQH
jgi:hypothetical protein